MRSHRGDLRLSNPDWNEYELLRAIRWLRAMLAADTDVTRLKRVQTVLDAVAEGTAGAFGDECFPRDGAPLRARARGRPRIHHRVRRRAGVAAYRYPFTWVTVRELWAAMDTTDADSGQTRRDESGRAGATTRAQR